MKKSIFIFFLLHQLYVSVNAKICSYSGYCSSSGDCVAGNICQKYSPHYSQCIPDTNIQNCVAEYRMCSIQLACCPSSNCTINPNSNYRKCIPLPCTNPSGFATQKVQFYQPAALDMENVSFSGSLVRYVHLSCDINIAIIVSS